MRIFTASLATETNTFSPVPTDMDSFKAAFYAGPGQHPETPTLCSSVVPILRRRGKAEGFTVIEGTSCWAEPAGLIQQQTYETLRDTILDELKAALPVDAVILGLHGAMVAQGYDDPEGDLLSRVREMVGPEVLIAAEFDPHSHLTARRLANLDLMAAFLEFPHTDFEERGEHVVDLALRTLRGEIKPLISTFDCRMITIYPTSREPMRSFVDRLKAMQGKNGILSISVIHGFMAGDVPDMGTRIVVVSDGNKVEGDRLAQELGHELYHMRKLTAMPMLETEAGLDRVLAIREQNPSLPVVISDIWDNPGGGVAGDATYILRRMMERGMDNFAVATIWDPVAVSFCHAAGEGAELEIRIGGKSSWQGGEPLDMRVTIRKVVEAGWQSFRNSRVNLGRVAVIRPIGTQIDIILITSRSQTYEPDIFSNLDIDFAARDVLLVKSTNHFQAGFQPISSEIVYIAAPTSYPTNPAVTPYRKASLELWPRVADPLGLD
ncbi:microcystin LR degradation protein MlrC-like protein [Falsochrobactrum shanghaiense]|uniref:Microcystinase C n=1 Tax=Falsochrobactrum shanghaiense TaxID=2201899 RepID=A0A316JAL0_9HYPH|nr:M81 family metallopeptidase [Falsochrobactrum shanghaiense]PWL18912.1 microcystin LR degradation protein MlrC-like protein [Falsochrobactrum shanghaiense]